MSEVGLEPTAGPGPRIRDAVSSAIAFWEPLRLVYNGVLALVVLGYFATNWPRSREAVSFDGVLVVFVLAVLANICYSAAYAADVFVQLSGFRDAWHRWRWILFAIGTAFAAVITRWFAIGFFAPSRGG